MGEHDSTLLAVTQVVNESGLDVAREALLADPLAHLLLVELALLLHHLGERSQVAGQELRQVLVLLRLLHLLVVFYFSSHWSQFA